MREITQQPVVFHWLPQHGPTESTDKNACFASEWQFKDRNAEIIVNVYNGTRQSGQDYRVISSRNIRINKDVGGKCLVTVCLIGPSAGAADDIPIDLEVHTYR